MVHFMYLLGIGETNEGQHETIHLLSWQLGHSVY